MANEKVFKIKIEGVEESRKASDDLVKVLKDMHSTVKKLNTVIPTTTSATKKVTTEIKKKAGAIEKEATAQEKLNKQLSEKAEILKDLVNAELKNADSIANARQELSSLNNEWANLDEGKTKFEEFTQAAEEFNNTFSDTATESSDANENLAASFQKLSTGTNTVIGTAEHIVGLFQSGVKVAQLFDSENNGLKNTMEELGKVMSAIGTIQAFNNEVLKIGSKESLASVAIEKIRAVQAAAGAKATALQTSTTIGATAAQAAFNLVAKANPYVLLAMALVTVVGAFVLFAKSADESAEAQAKLNREIENNKELAEQAGKIAGKQMVSFRNLKDEWNKLAGDLKAKKKFIEDNKDEFEKLGVEIDNVKDAENLLINNADEFEKALMQKAKAMAAQNLAVKQYEKALQKQIEIEDKEKQIEKMREKEVEVTMTDRILSSFTDKYTSSEKYAQDKWQEQIDKVKKEAEDLQNEMEEATASAGNFIKRSGENMDAAAKTMQDAQIKIAKPKKTAKGGNNKPSSDNENKLDELLAEERLKALEDQQKKEIKIIENARDKKLAAIKGNSEKETEIRKLLEENARKEIEKINEKYNNKEFENQINTQISLTKAKLAAVRAGSKEEYDLKIQLANDTALLEAENARNTIKDKELLDAKLLEISEKHKKEINDLEKGGELAESKDAYKKDLLDLTQQLEQKKISKQKYQEESKKLEVDALAKEIDIRKNNNQDTTDLEKQLSDKRISIAADEKDKRIKIVEEMMNNINSIFGAVGELFQMQVDDAKGKLEEITTQYDEIVSKREESDARIQELEEQAKNARGGRSLVLQAQIEREMEANKKLAAQEQDLAKQKEKQEKEIAKKEKQKKKLEISQNIVQGIVNTALGVTKALEWGFPLGPVFAGIIGAAGAIQVATMTAQLSKLEDGGLLKGKRHSEGGMRVEGTNIEVEGGEYVVNRISTDRNLGLIKYINSQRKELTQDDINTYFTGKAKVFELPFNNMFENGGQMPVMTATNGVTREDLLTVVDSIQNINIQPVVSVVDINNAQSDMVRVSDSFGS